MAPIRSLVVSVAVAIAVVAAFPGAARASHVRGAHFSWTSTGLTVHFHVMQEFKSDDVTPLPINPGDGDPTIIGPVSIVFTGTDLATDSYRIIEYNVDHTYPNTGPFTAYLGLDANSLNCCRLTNLVNASESDYRFETVVDLRNGDTASPASAIPPVASVPRIVRLPQGAVSASVDFPVTDPNGDPFVCAIASSVQSGIPTLAPGLAVTNIFGGCRLSMNTTGTLPFEKYAVQVELQEQNAPNFDGRAALDFIVEIAPPDCGDGVKQSPEQCDGADAAACPGACRPAGGPAECTCPVCNDGIIDAGEQCDGSAGGVFGPCPGACLTTGPNQCQCPVCGDDETTMTAGEECDGSSDAACPGRCLGDCTCAVCGDNVAEGPEQCDGSSDAACPGRCLGDCTCAVCGDNVAEGPEQCDGSSDAACPGRCLGDCTCAVCGDNVTSGSEQCDGSSDAACPGLCRPPADPNQCRCPVCGDGDVNAVGEVCDGADDALCPGDCTATCTCAVCGDNLAEAPAETCDGTDDAACPGQCAAPGGANECRCPVCGDGEINLPGEICDGGDDAACPGACAPPNAPNACRCPVCGDGIVNQGSEECDGAAGACDGGVCQPDCTYATCGNCDLDPGEQCDPPNPEICNNLVDDDGDGKINCDDTDCTPGRTCKHPSDPAVNALVSTLPCASSLDCNGICSHDLATPCTTDAECNALSTGSFCVDGAKCNCPDVAPVGFETCGATCAPVFGCRCIRNDPARIRFGKAGKPDLLKIHGRFLFDSAMDPPSDGFTLLLANTAGIVYQGTLVAGDLVGTAGQYKFTDRLAKTGAGTRDGLFRVIVRIKRVKGVINYVFKAQAYGDFSSASTFMTTQIIAGNDTASLSGEWSQSSAGWKLISFE